MIVLPETAVLAAIPKIVPRLTFQLYKGDMGRVGVIGGCREYTGAPYFAAISALKLGADLSHVFTSASAATVIKSYSPELIVHQLMHESTEVDGEESMAEKARDDVTAWFNRLDAVVVGPGLGQDSLNSKCAHLIIRSARDHNMTLILDADSLYLITKDRDLVQGYSEVVLTPNLNELRRLAIMLDIPTQCLTSESGQEREKIANEVARALKGPVVVSKGSFDVITDGEHCVRCTEASTPRRCGGQGDLLSGSAAVLVSWAKRAAATLLDSPGQFPPLIVAAYAACAITRRAAALTFATRGRSMVASEIIQNLSAALEEF